MPRRRPVLPVEVVPVLIAVAILGYVAGHSSVGRRSSEGQPAKGPNVALGYPAGWRVARVAPGIPGLTIENLTVLAPRGNAAREGLMLGSFAAGELAPLPAGFVASLRKLPVPQIVNLVETQAYKYPALEVPGYGRQLTMFVIPNPGSMPMVLACYAPLGARAQMRTCEQSATSVTVVGEPQAYDLTPEPAYARGISNAISTLDELRTTLKSELRSNITVQAAQRLATQLAEGYAQAGHALGRLIPSAADARVQAALADALEQTRARYVSLGRAVEERDAERYVAVRKQIAASEARVDSLLRSYVLLGYSTAPHS
jgi:hypothetical protein